ncbi:MAG TPA: hypothetical protein PL041_05030 [Melioribacteraceae bacterium]|nr:hypothetical protein [Melioribacteraceae bacterium]
MKNLYIVLVIMVLGFGCASNKTDMVLDDCSVNYNNINKIIKFNLPDSVNLKKFNPLVESEFVKIQKEGFDVSGYRTENKVFYNEVIKPYLIQYKSDLQKLPLKEAINEIAIFIHQAYRAYLGNDFYRWGGDINDLDDPQGEKSRGKYKYGLDCSGYTTSAYDAAVDLGLLDPSSDAAIFSSKGFEHYCKIYNLKDGGGIKDTPNNFRVDTKELAVLGKIIFSVKQGDAPTDEQIKMLQPGDIVGRSGHFGIIVFINNQPYYLESGGWVVPNHNWFPYCAKKALEIFARNGNLDIRRTLP